MMANTHLSLLTEYVPAGEKDVSGYIQTLVEKNKLLEMNPKFIGYNQALASITSRSKAQVKKTCRIPLPIKCRHTFAVKEDSDDYFFGKKFIAHKDGSIWCHVELVGVQKDSFRVGYSPDDETVVNIPSSISLASGAEDMSIGKNSNSPSLKSHSPKSMENLMDFSSFPKINSSIETIKAKIDNSVNAALITPQQNLGSPMQSRVLEN